jgi:hypothetical protein
MIGTKRPLTGKQMRAVRFLPDREGRLRDRALFDPALDGNLRLRLGQNQDRRRRLRPD